MPAQPLRRRIQGLFWELSPPLRRWLRRLKTEASVARHRVRGAADPRVVPRRANGAVRGIRHPAVALVDVASGAWTDISDPERHASFTAFSPDGEKVAYQWRGDLYVKGVGVGTGGPAFTPVNLEAITGPDVWDPICPTCTTNQQADYAVVDQFEDLIGLISDLVVRFCDP